MNLKQALKKYAIASMLSMVPLSLVNDPSNFKKKSISHAVHEVEAKRLAQRCSQNKSEESIAISQSGEVLDMTIYEKRSSEYIDDILTKSTTGVTFLKFMEFVHDNELTIKYHCHFSEEGAIPSYLDVYVATRLYAEVVKNNLDLQTNISSLAFRISDKNKQGIDVAQYMPNYKTVKGIDDIFKKYALLDISKVSDKGGKLIYSVELQLFALRRTLEYISSYSDCLSKRPKLDRLDLLECISKSGPFDVKNVEF